MGIVISSVIRDIAYNKLKPLSRTFFFIDYVAGSERLLADFDEANDYSCYRIRGVENSILKSHTLS